MEDMTIEILPAFFAQSNRLELLFAAIHIGDQG
jgi:hypothetical protein